MSDDVYVPSENGLYWWRSDKNGKTYFARVYALSGDLGTTYFMARYWPDEQDKCWQTKLEWFLEEGTFYPGPLVPPDGDDDE